MPAIARALSPALVLLAAACASRAAPPVPARGQARLAAADSSYARVRDLRDRLDVALAAGGSTGPHGTPVDSLTARYHSLRLELGPRLAAVDSAAFGREDGRALGLMRLAFARDLRPLAPADPTRRADRRPDCAYDARAVAATPNVDSLRARVYACYGWAQSHVAVGADTLDRLSILGRMGRTAEPAGRRALFLALAPVWRGVDGDGHRGSGLPR